MASDTDSGILPHSDEQLAKPADENAVELDRREAAKSDDVPQVCPKCGGRMEQGFVVDMGMGDLSIGARHVSHWQRGAPIRSLFFKTWVSWWNSLPIGTYRCETCGYLESFARKEFAATGQTQFSLRNLLIFVTVVSIVLGLIVWAARS